MKSILSVMIVSLAVVGCNSSSGGGGGAPANEVYPQGTVIGPYEQGQGPQNGQYGQTMQAGSYDAEIRCDNDNATRSMPEVAIEFSLQQDGNYTQEIYSVSERCYQNCVMIAQGTYSTNGNSITFNQTRLVNENGGMIQGPRNNTLQVDMSAPVPRSRKGKPVKQAIVLRDTGTENICGGPFRMYMKKQTGHNRH
jgi:hypothetical protein